MSWTSEDPRQGPDLSTTGSWPSQQQHNDQSLLQEISALKGRLQEISALKGRLQELEEDGRSSTFTATVIPSFSKQIDHYHLPISRNPSLQEQHSLQASQSGDSHESSSKHSHQESPKSHNSRETMTSPVESLQETTAAPSPPPLRSSSPTTTKFLLTSSEEQCNLLKKEIAQLEDDKARLEVEFMNSMASLSREKSDSLEKLELQLKESQQECQVLRIQVLAHQQSSSHDEGEDDQRDDHASSELKVQHDQAVDQVRRLTLDLRRAEEEICINTTHISELLQQSQELQSDKDALETAALEEKQRLLSEHEEEVQALQMDLEKVERERDGALEQMGDMNDAYMTLETKYDQSQKLLKESQGKVQVLEQSHPSNFDDLQDKYEVLQQEHKALKQSKATNVDELKQTVKKELQATHEIASSKLQQQVEAQESELKQLRQKVESQEALQTTNNKLRQEMKTLSHLETTNLQLRDQIKLLQQQQKSSGASEMPMTDKERDTIHQAVAQLEDRLVRFQERLQDKQTKIEALEAELAESKQGSENAKSVPEASRPPRDLQTPPRVTRKWPPPSSSTTSTTTAANQSPSKYRPSSSRANSPGPRTPVSGLVANFERRQVNEKKDGDCLDVTADLSDSDSASSHPTVAELQQELQKERETIRRLEKELERVRGNSSLQQQYGSTIQQSPSLTRKLLRDSEEETSQLKQEVERLETMRQESTKEIESLTKQLLQAKDQLKMSLRSSNATPSPTKKSMSRGSYHQRKPSSSSGMTSELEQKLARFEQGSAPKSPPPLSSTSGMTTELEQKLANFGKKSRLSFEDPADTSRYQKQIEMLESAKKRLARENEELRRSSQPSQNHNKSYHNSSESEAKLSAKEMELSRIKIQLREAEHRVQELEQTSRPVGVDLRATVEDLQNQLASERSLVKDLQTRLKQHKDDNSFSLNDKEQEVSQLRMQLQSTREFQKSSQAKIESMEQELACIKQNDVHGSEEVNRLRQQVESLQKELGSTLSKLNQQASEIDRLQTLVNEHEESQQARSSFVSTRETRRANQESRAEVHRMTDELTKTQVARGELEMSYMVRVKELETEIEEIETQAQKQIDELQDKLSKLQGNLDSQEEHVRRLENEKYQLCQSMSSASSNRNEDFEELQSELIEQTTTTNSQAREIQSLKMKLEEHDGQEEFLTRKVAELEATIRDNRDDANCDAAIVMEMERIQAENQSLRESIRQVKSERRTLQDRLDSLGNSSKTTQVLRDRNTALRKEVEKLTKRLKKMEESITRFAI